MATFDKFGAELVRLVSGTTAPTSDRTGARLLRPVDATGADLVFGGTPAGATGQIQFNDEDEFGAEALLFWDKVNKRLGIGTASPSQALHIKQDAGGQNLMILCENTHVGGEEPNQALFQMVTAGDGVVGLRFGKCAFAGPYKGLAFFDQSEYADMWFMTDNTPRMVVTKNGQVYIAATSDDGSNATLQVQAHTFDKFFNGIGTISSDGIGTAVIGTETAFTTQVQVGDILYSDETGASAVVTAIADDSNLTVNTPFGMTDSTFTFERTNVFAGDCSIAGSYWAQGQQGKTEDVTVGGVTLHFVGGAYMGHD